MGSYMLIEDWLGNARSWCRSSMRNAEHTEDSRKRGRFGRGVAGHYEALHMGFFRENAGEGHI